MSIEIKFDGKRFTRALGRLAGTARRTEAEVLRVQAAKMLRELWEGRTNERRDNIRGQGV